MLGLIKLGEGVAVNVLEKMGLDLEIAARVLKSLEVDPARTRNEILKELDPSFAPPESEAEYPQEGDSRQ